MGFERLLIYMNLIHVVTFVRRVESRHIFDIRTLAHVFSPTHQRRDAGDVQYSTINRDVRAARVNCACALHRLLQLQGRVAREYLNICNFAQTSAVPRPSEAAWLTYAGRVSAYRSGPIHFGLGPAQAAACLSPFKSESVLRDPLLPWYGHCRW